MLTVPAPRTHVQASIDDMPLNTIQIGDSEVYDKVDRTRDLSSEYAVSDSAGYLDLVAEHRLEPGIHRVSYSVKRRKPVSANLYTIPASAKVGIISDVDDTIMITQAPVLWKAAYNLLFLNPKKKASVPGMSSRASLICFPVRRSSTFRPRHGMWKVRFVTSSPIMGFLKARCCYAILTRARRPSCLPARSTNWSSPSSLWLIFRT